jgi:hypothetical protein
VARLPVRAIYSRDEAVVAAKARVLAVVRALEPTRPPLRRRAATGPGMLGKAEKLRNIEANPKRATLYGWPVLFAS